MTTETAPPPASSPTAAEGLGASPDVPPRHRRWRRPRWLRMGIQSRLLLMLLVTSILSALVVGIVGYRSGRQSLRESAFQRLTEVRESRSRELTRLYDQLLDSLVLYSRGATAVQALDGFTAGFAALEDEDVSPAATAAVEAYYTDVFVPGLENNTGLDSDPEGFIPTDNAQRYLQAAYTAPYESFDDAVQVDDAGDGSDWSAVHARYHDYFREMTLRFGYEDVLLIDGDGVVVYSAYKGVDLGTNLRTGPFQGSSVATAFESAMASNAVDFVATTDFERYQPSYNVPAGWAVSPIGNDGHIAGVLAVQIPIGSINAVMTGAEDWVADGLGETGETYLAGPDFLMRSASRLVLEDPERFASEAIAAGTPPDVAERAARVGGTILIQPVRTPAVERALRGETGTLVANDYLGHEVLAAYAPLEFEGLQWVIVAKLDTAEAFEPVRDFTRDLVLWSAVVILVVSVAALVLSQLFSRPLRRLVTGVRRLAAGEVGVEVDAQSSDEFGDLAVAFNEMSRSLRTKQDLLEAEQHENERLLSTLMPEAVARRYRDGEETIAEDHQDVVVLFADLVGFDDYARGLGSAEALAALNGLVRGFDDAAERTGVERVRTLRTGYLASCGLVSPRVDNAQRMVEFAMEMAAVVQRFNVTARASVALRVGIDRGQVTSGLIGRTSVVYDMWGDTVNLSYRVQGSSDQPGIYVTDRIYDRLRDLFTFESAGEFETASGHQLVWLLVLPET